MHMRDRELERYIVLNVHYLAAYTRGLFPTTIGAILIAFVIWLIE
ncbi:putative prophage membrane protein [Citrobacter rodentium ICC168]|uniref:Prophage membrane protein n=1 Tax=Citrobacter rodentium (strain ICC168) TaxID=637910 RepID=D2TNR3_CITRI|nr:putative prophage membrane protein [Citrobacter rodentium ICC168]